MEKRAVQARSKTDYFVKTIYLFIDTKLDHREKFCDVYMYVCVFLQKNTQKNVLGCGNTGRHKSRKGLNED